MKQIAIIGLIILLSTNTIYASVQHDIDTYGYYSYSDTQDHYVKWTNASSVGKIQVSIQYCRGVCGDGGEVYVQANIQNMPLADWYYKTLYDNAECVEDECYYACPTFSHTYDLVSGHFYHGGGISGGSGATNCGSGVTWKNTYIFYLGNEYFISGNTGCVDKVILSIKDNTDIYVEVDNKVLTSSDSFNFSIIEGESYYLNFSDGHAYQFDCTSNLVYNYDLCAYTTIYLKDYCGNTMTNTSVDIYKSDSGSFETYEFVGNYRNTNPVQLLVSDIGEGKMLDIYFDTDMETYHTIDYCEDKTISLLHPSKWWSISFGAFDDMTHNPIQYMKMTVNQSCKICPDRPLTTHGMTGDDGYKMFVYLSAENAYVKMDNDQYGGDKFFVGGLGDAFQTHYILDTYLNLSGTMPDDYHNETENMSAGCSIRFQDDSGRVDNRINDTDTYVDLYYNNGNCTATLKFQRLYSTYWMSKMSWNIPALESGYKRVYNVNFSDYNANYRGYMYAEACECNSTLSLYVTNETVEEEEHYQNLTASCWFRHQLGDGQVDYKSPIEIVAYGNATDAFLLDINLTLYNSTGELTTYQCDWADFSTASIKWYYVWQPSVNYISGENYTVVMTGYNGHKLDADEVWTSNFVGNELTVFVKDNYNQQVKYSTIFIEDWGSIATGAWNYATVTGLPDGDYQYKASKSGYIVSGWDTVTLTEHESVTCVLVALEETSVIGQKMADADIKSMFIPLMYILFIFMILGAFQYANK